jgi:hypothetical protein
VTARITPKLRCRLEPITIYAAWCGPDYQSCACRLLLPKVLAHRLGGVAGVYDLYEYADEKREALELWADMLAAIVDPKPTTPAKIIRLRQR